MATLDTLTLSYSRRVQLDQFEPVEFGATGEFRMEPDDDPDEIRRSGYEVLESYVERQLAYRVALHNFENDGASVPKLKALIRDFADDLDEDTITEIAEAVVEVRAE